MSTEPRTLTEELNSVLRAGSLNAPPPGATIEQVLAQVADAPGHRGRLHALRPDNLTRWIGAAAAVLLIGVGISQVHRLGGSGDGKSSATSATAAHGSAEDAPKAAGGSAAASADSTFGGALGGTPGGISASGGSFQLPATAATPTAVSGYGSSLLICPNNSAPVGQGFAIGTTKFDIEQAYCLTGLSSAAVSAGPSADTGLDADSGGSQVNVVTREDRAPEVTAILITADQHLRLEAVRVEGNTVVLRVLTSAELNEHYQGVSVTFPAGAVLDMPFTTTDGYNFTHGAASLVAAPCADARGITVTPLTSEPSTVLSDSAAAAIVLHNISSTPCAVSGYPDVHATFPGYDVIADQQPSGPYGGVASSLPPIIVLAPGSHATAILESGAAPSTHTRSCTSSSIVKITLPNTLDSALLPYRIALCGLQVHPFTNN